MYLRDFDPSKYLVLYLSVRALYYARPQSIIMRSFTYTHSLAFIVPTYIHTYLDGVSGHCWLALALGIKMSVIFHFF
jgi:hypothetical protein